MPSYTPLCITAEDQDDLTFIAACLQDALVPLSGVEYDKENKHFRLIANRFCWECDPEIQEDKSSYNRVLAGLTFHNVKEVSKKRLNPQNQGELVNLLTISVSEEDGCIYLVFSGDSTIKLRTEGVRCHLKDIDEPYPTSNKPVHK